MLAKMKKAADGFLSGKSKTQSMIDAGYAESTAVTNHTAVFANPEVVKYIERKQGLAAQKHSITLEYVVEQLKKIAEASVGDLIEVGSDGSINLDYTKMTPELRKALSGIVVDEITEGRGDSKKKIKRIKIQQLDKLRAWEMILRHTGISAEKTIIDVEGDLVERLSRGRKRSSGVPEED